jgi:hypothetical protein
MRKRLLLLSASLVVVGMTTAKAGAVTAASPGGNPVPAAGILSSDIFNNGSGNNNGTLVATQYVVTAAHVAYGFSAPFTFTVGGNTYNVNQVTIHPSYNGNVLDGNDIAVMHLATPVTNVTPVALYSGIPTELTQTVTFVGAGKTGNGTTGGTTYPGVVLSATNIFDQAGGIVTDGSGPHTVPTSVLFYDFDNNTPGNNKTGTMTPSSAEGMISQNDSGGGSFLTISGTTYLAGVHSFGLFADQNAPGKFGDVGADTRISSQLSFINSVVPEPATISVLAMAGLVLLGRRRRVPRRA